ncbi:N-alpha-acetyltransferase 80-like isoform X2 [Liolophura sinensis]|uniref:N-alpha-acetyltransferase 80-like isoform X2 n=1 Tax=Liolophura sinensis TaxID=3198878 RepID=UPI0031594856
MLDDNKKVIGHSRLSQMRGREGACLVESVVVRKTVRGQGHGRSIMEKTEEYAKRKGFQTMYLTTHDKQGFYQRLGYEFCEPVVSFGGDFANLPESFSKALAGLSGSTKQELGKTKRKDNTESEFHSISQHVAPQLPPQPPPSTVLEQPAPLTPAAPPPPLAPLAIPPPPPVATLPPKEPASLVKSSIVRWDPAKVSWLKKEL